MNQVIFGILLISKLVAVYFTIVSDCDESMNYFEPAHYMMHGTGLQTWEYTPKHSLRSWLYIAVHAIPAKYLAPQISGIFSGLPVKELEFYAIRMIIALFGSIAETSLLVQTRRTFGTVAQYFSLFFMCVAPGMFYASGSFLPSTTAMACIAFAYSMLMGLYNFGVNSANNYTFGSIFFVFVAGLFAWPFAAFAAIPIAVVLLSRVHCPRDFFRLVIFVIASAVLVLVPMVAYDSYMYGKLTIAPLNIVLYNVIFKPEGGSTLYGTEPWHFYIRNMILNFNIIAPLFCLALVISIPAFILERNREPGKVRTVNAPFVALLSGTLLWITFMSCMAHKEERFLYVVYPLLCVSAGFAITKVFYRLRQLWMPLSLVVTLLTVIVFGGLSVSRIIAIQNNYGASMVAWKTLAEQELPIQNFTTAKYPINVCIGKEWYRYASSFFLPSDNIHIKFVRSGFDGQLPQWFGEHPWSEPKQHFNDVNKMEPERYVKDINAECHYIVEFEFPGQSEERMSDWAIIDYKILDDPSIDDADKVPDWSVIWFAPFLDAPRSPRLTRSFYIPVAFLPNKTDPNNYGEYEVMRNDGLIERESHARGEHRDKGKHVHCTLCMKGVEH